MNANDQNADSRVRKAISYSFKGHSMPQEKRVLKFNTATGSGPAVGSYQAIDGNMKIKVNNVFNKAERKFAFPI